MPTNKQIKLIFVCIVFILSVFGVIAVDSSSKPSTSFENESRETALENVYEEEVLGQSDVVEASPVLSAAPEEIEEDRLNEIENEPIGEAGYRVVKVVDGDTLDVDVEGKIERLRLIGIDTPETVDPRKEVQCFGLEASNKAKELLQGQFVTLESDDTQGDKDKYKRLLRYVFLPTGINFNQLMISEGYAYEYTYANPYRYQAEFKAAQHQAVEGQKGLWSPSSCSGNR